MEPPGTHPKTPGTLEGTTARGLFSGQHIEVCSGQLRNPSLTSTSLLFIGDLGHLGTLSLHIRHASSAVGNGRQLVPQFG